MGISHRQQWFDLGGDSPITQVINLEVIPKNDDHIVTGGHIIRDQTGRFKNTGFYGQFAYRLKMEGKYTRQNGIRSDLVIGINAGFIQPWQFDASEINLLDSDEALPETNRKWYPDFSIGVFYYYGNKFYAGLSVPQVIGLNRYLSNTSNNEDYKLQRVAHFYGIVGGYLNVDWFNSPAIVEPSLWIRYVPGTPISIDGNLRYSIKDNFWCGLGLGLGFGSSISSATRMEVGVLLGESIGIKNQLKIGVAYDLVQLTGSPSQGNFNVFGNGPHHDS